MDRSTSPAVVVVLAAVVVVMPVTAAMSVGGPASHGAPTDVGGPASVGASPPSPSDNTSARLVLPRYRVEQNRFKTVRIGMGSTLQAGADDARFEHERITVERDFEAAETVEERRNVIDRALIELSAAADDLEARERATIRDYGNGTITTRTMVRRLARIDAAAREIVTTLAMVRRLTARIGTADFDSRIRDIGGIVEPLRGPVRNQISEALSGEAPAVRVHVTASDRGLVLSMLHEGAYVREATRWSNRNRTAPPTLDFGDIGERFEVLYPWVTAQQGGTSINWQGAGAWQLRASHSQGELTASVDASTAAVYREVQTLSVEEMPSTMTVVRTEQGVRMTFMRTYAGGPLRLLVEDASTDAVINARVSVDGHELGRIGADGLVVTLEPTPPYTVNVTGNGSSLSVTMERPFNASP
jgi:hypothetical protein